MIRIPECLEKKYSKAIKTVRDSKFIRVIGHYDADGISSAAIIYRTLMEDKKKLHVSFRREYNRSAIEEYMEGPYDCYIFVDIGASMVPYLENYAKNGKNIIIMDHHQSTYDSENIIHVNPHLCGMDGTSEACGATLSYIFSMLYDEDNWIMYPSFFAGVLGDRQNIDGYTGLNKLIVEYLENVKGLNKAITLSLEGSNVFEMLMFATDPFLLNITGREQEIKNILKKLRIREDEKFQNLEENKRNDLISYITLHLMKVGIDNDIIKGIIREKYDVIATSRIYLSDASLSGIIDACGKEESHSVGLLFLNYPERYLDNALNIWKSYKTKLIEELYYSYENRKELDNLYLLPVKESSYTGPVAGILITYALPGMKPGIGYFISNGNVKISARATKKMVSEDLNLGKILGECSAQYAGTGGGHNIAAGATVPEKNFSEFIKCLNLKISESYNKD